MKKVKLAKKAGFCFGVERAVRTVYQEAMEGQKPVCTYGPIIHNEEVTADLERKGIRVLHTIEEAKSLESGTVIIRSHGVTRQEQKCLEQTGLTIVDATCPFVKKIHRLVEEYSRKGYEIVVIGNDDHPEVRGIVGWSDAAHTTVIRTEQEAQNFVPDGDRDICIVAQTTFHHKKFKDLVEIILKKGYDKLDTIKQNRANVVQNTICSATQERQEAAAALSGEVDAMLVIGGSGSSNTRKLYEICSENCQNTYLIQTKEDLKHSDLSRFDYVGITAGASTPNNIIEEVQKYVRNEL